MPAFAIETCVADRCDVDLSFGTLADFGLAGPD